MFPRRASGFIIHKIGVFARKKSTFTFSDEVRNALQHSKPVVALESTIITHGMPYPENLNTALKVQSIIRENGAVPATIGILSGQVKIGLTDLEIESLARKDESHQTIKVSRRDLPYVIGKKMNGGTTVAATMILAHQANIPIFVTGGIGGVHRGAETSFDISADLTELGRTPMTVVCAGVKSILDIGKTLEYLETEGVTVASYGSSTNFPSFFTSNSGFQSPCNVETAFEAAAMINARDQLNLSNAVLVAVPIPEETDRDLEIQQVIDRAVEEAKIHKIFGKETTPFILKRVNELTEGNSLKLNKKLIENNAEIGARIAVELARLKECRIDKSNFASRVVVIGGTNIDYVMNIKEEVTFDGRSLKGSIQRLHGGVGRNVADCISRLCPDQKPLFISVVGSDEAGVEIERHEPGVTKLNDKATATHCVVINEKGEYLFGIADMDIHQQISEPIISKYEKHIEKAKLVIVDGNMPVRTLQYVLERCNDYGVPVWFEPTDPGIAGKPFETESWKKLTYVSPNYQELLTMYSCLPDKKVALTNDVIQNTIRICSDPNFVIPVVIVTLGDKGVIVRYGKSSTCGIHRATFTSDDVIIRHFPADKIPEIRRKNMSGAGDCLAGTVISALTQGYDLEFAIKAGIVAAEKSIASQMTVPSTINPDIFMQVDKKL